MIEAGVLEWPETETVISAEHAEYGPLLQTCTVLKVPASVTRIAVGACRNNEQLKRVIIDTESQLKSIGARSFEGTGISEFDIPDSVTEIEANAFLYCDKLQRLGLSSHSQLQSIGDQAFMGCDLRTFAVPWHLQELGARSFADNYNLLKITGLNNKVFRGRHCFCHTPISELSTLFP